MRFATWNIKNTGKEHAYRRVQFLSDWPWDILALQEVSPTAWEIIRNSGLSESGIYTFDGFNLTPIGKRPHGVAILARHGYQLGEPRLISNLPKAERALTAITKTSDSYVNLISWHAPNAAGEGVEVKMQGYRGILNGLNALQGPTVMGFDANHWNLSIEIDVPFVPSDDNKWLLENQFFGSNGLHTLRDAYLDYLKHNPREYAEIVKMRPIGPLAVSYIRGSTMNPVEDRFDYIFVSPDINVINCTYEYSKAKEAGSDHGIVFADLIL